VKGLLVDFGGVLTTNVFDSFKAFCRAEGLPFHAISSVTGLGLPELVRDISTLLAKGTWARAGR